VQEVPFPEKPVLQAQEKVPGPVEVHVPLEEQLLAPVVQLLIAARGNKLRCTKEKRRERKTNQHKFDHFQNIQYYMSR